MLLVENLVYNYPRRPGAQAVLRGINLRLLPGEVVCLVGPNGCGKSTLVKHLKGLLFANAGRVMVDGLDPERPENRRAVHCAVGLVGPDPDSQLVATLVEEEVAFGPANLNLSPSEVRSRVDAALSSAGIGALAGKAVQFLSAGQKQKVVLAAVLAMRPRYLILDEAAAMLEPRARRELAVLCRDLARSLGLGVLIVTHSGEEFAVANRLIVMEDGRICWEGNREEFLSHHKEFCRLFLGRLPEEELVAGLIRAGYPLPQALLTPEEVGERLCSSN